MENFNPLVQNLKSRLPGQTFRLPSLAIFYENNELTDDVINGEVHVYPMSAIDEIALNTPDLLINGTAVINVIKRCVPQVNKPEYLLSKDIDYLMACLRFVSYGPTVEITHKHTCENAKQHTYSIPIEPIIKKTKEIDPTIVKNTSTITTPEGQKVILKPIVFKDIIELYQSLTIENQNTATLVQEKLVENYANMINDVDGVFDKQMIVEWLQSVPINTFTLIRERIEQLLDFGIDPTCEIQCRDCNEKVIVDIPINPIGFFT
jgi:hypothetical protein